MEQYKKSTTKPIVGQYYELRFKDEDYYWIFVVKAVDQDNIRVRWLYSTHPNYTAHVTRHHETWDIVLWNSKHWIMKPLKSNTAEVLYGT